MAKYDLFFDREGKNWHSSHYVEFQLHWSPLKSLWPKAHTQKNSSKTTNVSVLKREKVCQETFNKNDYFRTGGNKIIEEMFHAWSNFEEKSLYSLEVTYWRSLSYLRTFSNRIMKASLAAPQKFFPLMAIFIKQQNV